MSGILILAALSLTALFLLPAAAETASYVYYQLTERIVPGVRVGETYLGGQTIEQAAVELHKTWNLERRITVTDGLHSWTLQPAQLGISLDALETARRAYAVAHNPWVIEGFKEMLVSQWQGAEIMPVITFDQNVLLAELQALNGEASQPARDAALHLEEGKLVVVPSQLGYAINVDAAVSGISADPAALLESGSVRLTLKPLVPQVEDVSSALAQAQHLLDTPVTLQVYDVISDDITPLEIPRDALASMLVFRPGENGPVAGVDADKAAAYLSSLDGALGQGRYLNGNQYGALLAEAIQNGTALTVAASHQPTSYQVLPGDTLISIGWKVGVPYWMIIQANPGMDPDTLIAGQNLVIPSKDDLLPLPIIPGKRVVISISQQRMRVYQNGALVQKFVISTGIDRSPTQPGVFQVRTHEPNAYASVWDLHMPDFLGIYEAWPGFMNGVHGLPTLSNGRRLWAGILGKPVSYGCIILDLDASAWLYSWAENGVVVEIQP